MKGGHHLYKRLGVSNTQLKKQSKTHIINLRKRIN